MTDPSLSPHRRIRVILAVLVPVLALAIAGGTALSSAATSKPTTLTIAKGVPVAGHAEDIVANTHGLTVYTLSGETAHHLKCTSANGCLPIWVPVTVRGKNAKPTAAHGIHGRLALLHRAGLFQVTLGGRPLYTFAGDGARKRSAAGQGIVSFGGTWKVVALRSSGSQTTTSSTTSTSSTYVNPYGY